MAVRPQADLRQVQPRALLAVQAVPSEPAGRVHIGKTDASFNGRPGNARAFAVALRGRPLRTASNHPAEAHKITPFALWFIHFRKRRLELGPALC